MTTSLFLNMTENRVTLKFEKGTILDVTIWELVLRFLYQNEHLYHFEPESELKLFLDGEEIQKPDFLKDDEE